MSVTSENCDVHLHQEIELLKQTLADKQTQLIAMETACLRESDRQVELEDSIIAWQDKYDRLYESHKRVQKVNQNLEDKLLKLVDRNAGERAQLTSDVATLSVRLAQANYNIATLQRDIERYKTDMSLAIQLLQCKPNSFVSQKVASLPLEIQSKVTQYMRLDTNSHSDSEGSVSGVGATSTGHYRVLPASDSPAPICPFPPTAMVYSMRGLDAPDYNQIANKDELISPDIMVKYLEDELKDSERKHCDTCTCTTRDLTVLADLPKTYDIGTQTTLYGDNQNSLCLRCNSNLNSPSRTNSPYIMKLVKSSDSVISETKSSVSESQIIDLVDKPITIQSTKKDDLMVNPILGHHRLCDRLAMSHKLQRKNNATPLRHQSINTDYSNSLNGNSITNEYGTNPTKSPLKLTINQDQVSPNSISDTGKSTENNIVTNSTTSSWSKTSSNNSTSKYGAKAFENFNRNLIKTIKGDNQKVTGPRICALRIQNGTSNILLDNMESEVQQSIVYTRRNRLLDEELDETKDIITSPINDRTSKETKNSPSTLSQPAHLISLFSNNPQSNEPLEISCLKIDGPNSNKTLIELESTVHKTTSKLEPDPVAITPTTQSSSISSELEVKDNVMLRCQQLTRVAEWVQNNNLECNKIKSDNYLFNQLFPTTKCILDSDINLIKCDSVNGGIVGNNDSLTTISDIKEKNVIFSSSSIAQKCNFNTDNDSLMNLNCPIDRNVCKINNNHKNNHSKEINAQDLAQMEYNVKQFLLKQNEWSIDNRNHSHCIDNRSVKLEQLPDTSHLSAVDNSNSNLTPHRTETNL